jgi:cell cycle sensor histidine kinase DivJ
VDNVGLLKPIRDYIDTLVHPSALNDTLTAARHRAFIAPRLLGSVVALAAFPIYIAMRGVPGVLEVLVFSWLVLPILTAYYLSRTGQYESAHVISSLALTGLVTAVAAETGGIASFAAIWLVVVPLEAALSASRRVVALASTFALVAAGLLHFLGIQAVLPPADGMGAGTLAALGIISASLYATGLALGAESLARTSFWLLYAEEDRYRLLARNMTDVITRHGKNGAVLFVSPAAETLFSTKVSELHGHHLFDRVHVADRPAYLTALADAASLGEARSVEFRVRLDLPVHDAGAAEKFQLASRFIWVEMRCRRLDCTGGKIGEPEVVAVMRDVTERKVHEQALDQARAEADRANASKVKFLANMSHELRTPLNAIIGFSDMLMNEERMRLDGVRRHEYAKLINDSGTHLLAVVNGILDMSKMETGDFEISPEPFAPAQVIDNCCDIMALKARELGLDLTKRLADLPEVTADKRAFKQILLNLISNAVKFTDRGGRVTVIARVEAADILIAVEDTGVGISDDDLPRIGQPFFQARGAYDRRHDGTGLGLSIVQGLVALHGGEVNIVSRLGEGTRVTVRLPIDGEAVPQARKPSNVTRPSFDRVAEAESLIKKTA